MQSRDENQDLGSTRQTFTPQTSTKAIGVVVLAIIVGILLVAIVNANDFEEAASADTTTTTTTVDTEPASDDEETTTTTSQPVADSQNPSDVQLLVLNGSNAAGIAGNVSDALSERDYQTLTPANDTAKGSGTTVYYKTGFESDARQLANNVLPGVLRNLGIGQEVSIERFPSTAPSTWDQDDLVAANIVVVVGNA